MWREPSFSGEGWAPYWTAVQEPNYQRPPVKTGGLVTLGERHPESATPVTGILHQGTFCGCLQCVFTSRWDAADLMEQDHVGEDL